MNEMEISFELSSLGANSVHLCWNSSGQLSRIDLNASTFFKGAKRPLQHALALGLPPYLTELHVALQRFFDEGIPLPQPRWESIDENVWSVFQKKVYRAIAMIPPGETRTYGWVASQIGSVSATRAVGQALKRNPIPLLIPCHRVVSPHSLGGFMGISDPNFPEIKLKTSLLNLEESFLNPTFLFLQHRRAVA